MGAIPGRTLIAAAVTVAAVTAATNLAAGAPQLSAPIWTTASGESLETDLDGLLTILREADVVERERFDEGGRPRAFDDSSEGGRGTYHVRLRQGDIEIAAIFRSIDDRFQVAHFQDGSTAVHFRDFGLFECAAYELARAIGADHVLPAVPRRVGNVEGCLQLRLVDAFSESERDSSGRADPAAQRWNKQLATMNVFDALIGNTDRNRQNLLYDATWRVWLTDHTRAFSIDPRLDLASLQAVETRVWHGMSRLTADALDELLGDYLTGGEKEALIDRHRRLIDHFRSLIAERGEARVVYAY